LPEAELPQSISKANLEFGRSVHIIGKAVPMDRIRVKLRLVPQGAGFLSFEAGQDQCVFVFD